MDVFDFLKEEQDLIRAELTELVKNFRHKTRERLFDEVKLICDKLRGYVEKQSSLLLTGLPINDDLDSQLKSTQEKREELVGDLNNLLMVHVDEPGYRDCLANMLNRTLDYFTASEELYITIQLYLPKQTRDQMNKDLKDLIHSDVGFNSLQSGAIK